MKKKHLTVEVHQSNLKQGTKKNADLSIYCLRKNDILDRVHSPRLNLQPGDFSTMIFSPAFATPSGLNPEKLPTRLCLFAYSGLSPLVLFHPTHNSTMVQPGPSVQRLKQVWPEVNLFCPLSVNMTPLHHYETWRSNTSALDSHQQAWGHRLTSTATTNG